MSDVKSNKKNNKEDKQKRPNFFVRLGKWFARLFKGLFSELGKVSWPSKSKVIKKTSVVIAVVTVFLLVIMGFDAILGALYRLATKDLGTGTANIVATIAHLGGL